MMTYQTVVRLTLSLNRGPVAMPVSRWMLKTPNIVRLVAGRKRSPLDQALPPAASDVRRGLSRTLRRPTSRSRRDTRAFWTGPFFGS